MRASRLLQILLLLQNRGRMTATALARELEVVPRTILRDMDALSEAGLPIVTYQGNQGGFELGFAYRTRLTGLSADEAEALAVLLADPTPRADALGMGEAARRAAGKLYESLPDQVRDKVRRARAQFLFVPQPAETDPRLPALAAAIRARQIVRLAARSAKPREVHPLALRHDASGWSLLDARDPANAIPVAQWHDINISAQQFAPEAGVSAVSRPPRPAADRSG